MRPLPAFALCLAGPLLLAACAANPTDRYEWPITVAPAANQPERVVAVPPDCGPSPRTVPALVVNAWHNPSLGLGCSQARNLAVQVEEPRDLLAGRSAAPPDAEHEAAAVRRYREDEVKDLMRNDTRASFGTAGGDSGGASGQ